jgi:hypothetical protein
MAGPPHQVRGAPDAQETCPDWVNATKCQTQVLTSNTCSTPCSCHDADITPGTIIPPWYGERLDLDYAIYTCFANAEYQARQRNQPEHPDQHAEAPTPAPQDEPWRPTVTEVDVIAGIRQQCQKYATTAHR